MKDAKRAARRIVSRDAKTIGNGDAVAVANESGYAVGAILRACSVLRAFRSDQEALRLHELVERTNLHKATVFRTLQSLVAGGMLRRVCQDQYRCQFTTVKEQKIKIAYAEMARDSVFSMDVTRGLRLAIKDTEFELEESDNRYSASVAIQNAKRMVKAGVALAIEVQIHEDIAPVISNIFREAKIPLIAVDIPHPGAVFFGGDNYQAGRIGGRELGRFALANWKGKVDVVLLLSLKAAGAIPHSRITGMAMGVKEVLPLLERDQVVMVDGNGGYVESMQAVRSFLSKFQGKRVLVGAQNDASALGAIGVFEERPGNIEVAVVGQNASSAARTELRKTGSRLIGSVAFFPETYGLNLVKLARDMLDGKAVPPAVFVKHVMITKENVDHYYSNDALLDVPQRDLLLWHSFH
jgi:ribose transport system substrate-binding protein